ncbi:hypothetical protein RMATCC62417_11741 [Rhizopus microsporus]|nr:hypothetical protein RMATCC62417_11741 [Rhizopus microsporus]
MKDVSTSEDDSNLLVIILDTNPFAWNDSAKAKVPLSLDDALNQILVFVNAHLSLKHNNSVAVIASHVGHSKFLYPLHEEMSMNGSRRDANIYPIFQFVTEQVVSNLQKLFNTDTDFLKRDTGSMPTITGALSMALCYINRITKLDDEGYIKPRILVLSVSPDSAFQYIPLMNCIFSAQKASFSRNVKISQEEEEELAEALREEEKEADIKTEQDINTDALLSSDNKPDTDVEMTDAFTNPADDQPPIPKSATESEEEGEVKSTHSQSPRSRSPHTQSEMLMSVDNFSKDNDVHPSPYEDALEDGEIAE